MDPETGASLSTAYEQHQQRLLASIIKWINIAILATVLVNSYYLLTEFWKTVGQNLLALAIAGVGLGCSWLSGRGHLRLAARTYLAVGMILASLQVLVLSPNFILNGPLALALFVLIATYLDQPEAALRWGGASILLYVVALSARLLGPFEDLGIATPDLVILYLLPAIGLLAFALLGRNATGRIRQTLEQTETARQELELSNLALQESETKLEATIRKLQVELGERERIEDELRQSLEATARGQRLLLALSHGARSVLQAGAPEEVYRTVGDEIRELGYGALVLRPDSGGTHLQVAYVSFERDLLAEAEELLGFPILGYRIPRDRGRIVWQVVEEGRTILVDGYEDLVEAAVPGPVRTRAREMAASLGMRQAITAPMSVDDQTFGLLVVTGTCLTENERQAVSAFAGQAAIALTNVRLLQEVRDWATELEERVQERTRDLARSEARYRRLFNTNRDALCVVDAQGHILDANPAASQLLGYDHQELLAANILAIDAEAAEASPADRARILREIPPDREEGLYSSERIAITRDGARIAVEVGLTPVTYEGREAVLAALRDITARKRTEQELRSSQDRAIQNHRRLLALSQTAQDVQRAGTEEQVYEVIGKEIKQLGFEAAVLRMTSDPSSLAVTFWTFDSTALRTAERLAGLAAHSVQIRLDPDDALKHVLDSGESVFFDNTADRIARGVPRLGRILIKRVVGMLGIDRSIYAPLRIGGRTEGILMVAARDLNKSDVPAIAILANQAGVAIENARLLEDQRASQARMQRLARQVMTAQEEERQRISRALHDESGQALTALRISLELIAQDLPPELESTGKRILDAASLADSTMERIRLMAQNLRPPALDTIGLSPTLESFCQDFARRTQIQIEYQGLDFPPVPGPAGITLYRFLQEALTNVARHAGADSVRVELGASAEGLTLVVKDDGVGFELGAERSATEPHGSMGLENMRERLKSLGGGLDIVSRPGQGTRLSAFVPTRSTTDEPSV